MAATPAPPVPAGPNGFDIDKRQAIGIALGLLCLGLIIGFRLAGGEPLIIEKPVDRVIIKEAPCADCAEKKAPPAAEPWRTNEPHQSVPGDSSIPED